MGEQQPQTLAMDTDHQDLVAAGWTHCPEEAHLKWQHPNGGKFTESEALKIVAQDQAKKKLTDEMFEAGFDRMQDGHWRCPDLSVVTEDAAVALYQSSKNGDKLEEYEGPTLDSNSNEPCQAEPGNGETEGEKCSDDREPVTPDPLGRIFLAQMEVRRKQAKVEECKEKLKAAKADEELSVQKLMDEIDNAKQVQPTLFDKPAGMGESTDPKEQADSAESTEFKERPDESWRNLPLGEVLTGMPASTIESLRDQTLDTLGQLTDWLKDERRHLTDLKGIGQAKAEKIENKLMEFWERWNQRSQNGAAREEPGEPPQAPTDSLELAEAVQN